jgi:hypothetical protein
MHCTRVPSHKTRARRQNEQVIGSRLCLDMYTNSNFFFDQRGSFDRAPAAWVSVCIRVSIVYYVFYVLVCN